MNWAANNFERIKVSVLADFALTFLAENEDDKDAVQSTDPETYPQSRSYVLLRRFEWLIC
jgi:hypothetical protein